MGRLKSLTANLSVLVVVTYLIVWISTLPPAKNRRWDKVMNWTAEEKESTTSLTESKKKTPKNLPKVVRPRPLKSPQDLGKLLDKFRTEKILERKRSREKSSIAKGLETLNRLIRKDSRAMPFFAESGEKRKILIATTWRSGSTFLGTILNQIPMTFYSFEPLIESVLKNNTSTRANPVPPWKIVEAVMKCNFSNHDYGSKRTEWLIRKNSRYYRACIGLRSLPAHVPCHDRRVLTTYCKRFPIRLIKTVRLRFRSIWQLMEKLKDLMVIALFRDPRGMLNSRYHEAWCREDKCLAVDQVCQRYDQDLDDAFKLKVRYPSRVTVLKYEDLVEETEPRIASLLTDFLDLGEAVRPLVGYFADQENLMSTSKRRLLPSRGLRSWRSELPWSNVTEIQGFCKEPMKRLGYQEISREELLESQRAKNVTTTNATSATNEKNVQ